MQDWTLAAPKLNEETEYGTVVALIDESGWGSYSDWLDPVVSEACRRGDLYGASLFEFLGQLDIELFAEDEWYGGLPGTTYIGIAFSDRKATLQFAEEALAKLPESSEEEDDDEGE